ncbi:MAG: anti-sigma factor antagonist [Oscillospiraceae bacterium]|nr:anti-sigma factor antagonist [Oscillospiraceae bacterium]
MPMICTAENRTLTVRLAGEIDHHAARQLMMELDREIERRFPKLLILDFASVSFMDSSGIALLLRTWRRTQEVSGAMKVIHVPKQPGKVLKAANLHRMIPITFEEL